MAWCVPSLWHTIVDFNVIQSVCLGLFIFKRHTAQSVFSEMSRAGSANVPIYSKINCEVKFHSFVLETIEVLCGRHF